MDEPSLNERHLMREQEALKADADRMVETVAKMDEKLAAMSERLAAMQGNLDQAALGAQAEPPLDLGERLNQYEPMLNAMVRDIRTARDAREHIERKMEDQARQLDTALGQLAPVPDGSPQELVEANKTGVLNWIKQLADERNAAIEQADLVEQLAVTVDDLSSELEACRAHLQSELDAHHATEARLEPARQVVIAVRNMVDAGEIDTEASGYRGLVALLQKYEQGG